MGEEGGEESQKNDVGLAGRRELRATQCLMHLKRRTFQFFLIFFWWDRGGGLSEFPSTSDMFTESAEFILGRFESGGVTISAKK